MNKINNKIKYYRRLKDLTQTQLADIVNITRTYVSEIENNGANPSIAIALKIAKALDVSVHDIFFINSTLKS